MATRANLGVEFYLVGMEDVAKRAFHARYADHPVSPPDLHVRIWGSCQIEG